MANDFFEKMCKEAIAELAKGEVSFKDTPTNTLLLACFGLLTNHLTHKLTRPLWWFTGAVSAGIVTYIVSTILSG